MTHKNPKYLAFVRTLPCSLCKNPKAEPHHIIGIGMGATGAKASDIHTMPVCRPCHRMIHLDVQGFDMVQVRRMIETQDRWLAHQKGEDETLDLPF